MTITTPYSDIEQFIAALNAERRRNSQQWIFYSGIVDGHIVELKTFGHTYLQRFTIDDYRPNLPPMDCAVGVWKAAILEGFNAFRRPDLTNAPEL